MRNMIWIVATLTFAWGGLAGCRGERSTRNSPRSPSVTLGDVNPGEGDTDPGDATSGDASGGDAAIPGDGASGGDTIGGGDDIVDSCSAATLGHLRCTGSEVEQCAAVDSSFAWTAMRTCVESCVEMPATNRAYCTESTASFESCTSSDECRVGDHCANVASLGFPLSLAVCLRNCDADTDCPSGECMPEFAATDGSTGGACSIGTTSSGGSCGFSGYACAEGSECAFGVGIVSATCRTLCTSVEDCESPSVCSPADGWVPMLVAGGGVKSCNDVGKTSECVEEDGARCRYGTGAYEGQNICMVRPKYCGKPNPVLGSYEALSYGNACGSFGSSSSCNPESGGDAWVACTLTSQLWLEKLGGEEVACEPAGSQPDAECSFKQGYKCMLTDTGHRCARPLAGCFAFCDDLDSGTTLSCAPGQVCARPSTPVDWIRQTNSAGEVVSCTGPADCDLAGGYTCEGELPGEGAPICARVLNICLDT